jgi:hypothetical protein
MKKLICLLSLILAILLSLKTTAQNKSINSNEPDELRKNSFYLEILGNGAVYSFNFDRLFPIKKPLALVIRVGGNEYHASDTEEKSYNFLGSVGLISGKLRHFVEGGLGYTYFSDSPDRLTIFSLGYRFQGRKGLLIRATPMYINNSEKGNTFGNGLWFGASIGFSF